VVGPIVQNYIRKSKTTFGYRGDLGQFIYIYIRTHGKEMFGYGGIGLSH